MRRPLLAAAILASLLLSTSRATPAEIDWRAHATRHYFLVNGYDYQEVRPSLFASYRRSCTHLEVKEYATLLRINFICEL